MVLKPSIRLSGFADKDYWLYWIISQVLAKVGPEVTHRENRGIKTQFHPLTHLATHPPSPVFLNQFITVRIDQRGRPDAFWFVHIKACEPAAKVLQVGTQNYLSSQHPRVCYLWTKSLACLRVSMKAVAGLPGHDTPHCCLCPQNSQRGEHSKGTESLRLTWPD